MPTSDDHLASDHGRHRRQAHFTAGASDGFTLQPTTLPGSLAQFTDHVVPILGRKPEGTS
jgi:alkanesulfonate monooxygenase SsuD/methylene tetrahydromethanopterin reductase-like flavin-dependent oxidoreductase (luciferase family)